MKICPRCQKTYTDDNLNFCLEDGSTLQQMAGGAPPPTVAMHPPVTAPDQPMTGQPGWNTPQQYGGQPQKRSSKAWIWVLVILGLLVVVCGGGFGLLAYIGYRSEQANSNRFISTNTSTSNTRTSTSTDRSTSNSSTTTTSSTDSNRTDVTELDFNMFVQKFSIYGTTEIEGDELMVKANSGIAYYVLAAPDDYGDEEADTRITLRNTTGAACARGYGLVFHSNPTPLQQGYAFLIDTKRGRYAVVHHEPGKEGSVISWRSSNLINSGTAENTLEVRDHDKTIELYINGTKVNSISNEYGYAGGVPGIYVGQGVKIAFKDFEIRK
jgi:hypothetical protein